MVIYAHTLLRKTEHELRERAPSGASVLCGSECADEIERRRRFMEADVAFGNIPVPWLRDARRLLWVQLEAVGIESYLRASGEPWTTRMAVTSLRGFFGTPVAETIVGGVLACYRGLPDLVRLQSEERWALTQIRAGIRTLEGARAIVLGAGSIGAHVRKLLSAFGTKTLTFARSSPDAEIRTVEELDLKLPEADIVFACLPETPATIRLFDANRLAKMKPTAILANGGRGSLIDEEALIASLKADRLGGAVLDVTATEPLPPGHPLWGLRNVVLTQHTGGGFANESLGKVEFFLRNLDRFSKGTPLVNAVDFSRDC